MQQKIIELFENKVDISDIQDPQSEEGKSRCLTRYLAAYAVMNYAQTSEIDAANSIVDGYNDNGIDAIYYAPNNKKNCHCSIQMGFIKAVDNLTMVM